MENLQPNSKSCFVCGLQNPYGLQLRFFKTGKEEVTTHFTVPEAYQGYPGVVHGGVTAAMLDEVLGRALMGTDPKVTRFMVTARLTVRYRKNVPTGEPLKIVGRVTRDRGHTASATGWIYDASGLVLAEAEGLLVGVPEEVLASADLDTLGWRLYPEEEKN